MKINFFITVDVETGFGFELDEFVYGKVGNNYYRIPMIMDVCERHNVRATFFISVFEYVYYGKEKMERICRSISERGHDVELHTHPVWLDKSRHYMFQYSLPEQIELIKRGSQLLREWVGKRCIVHRAGTFAANLDTLKALKENNIPLDSSMYYSYYFRGTNLCKLNDFLPVKNKMIKYENIIEIPITTFQEVRCLFSIPFMNCISCCNIRKKLYTVKALVSNVIERNLPTIVMMGHSNSFIDADLRKQKIKPRLKEIYEFDRTLSWLSRHNRIKICTLREWFCQREKDYGDGRDELFRINVNYFSG